MHVRSLAGVIAGALILAACSDTLPTRPTPELSLDRSSTPGTRRYIVMAVGNGIPHDLASDVARYGGIVTDSAPQVGLVFVSSSSASFASNAARIPGVRSVMPDPVVQWIPHPRTAGSITEEAAADAAVTTIDDPFQAVQWNLRAIHAQEAWSTGDIGSGARVFILDSGIDCTHPDLAPNVNVALSVSFVPGETACVTPGRYFNHGTHVAGIIGAAANGYGMVGVAPGAELVAVKVVPEMRESGSFGALILGLAYAADHGADIINISLGTHSLPRRGFVDAEGNVATARDLSELVTAMSRVTTYAYQKGSTIIVAAGNDTLNRNTDDDGVVIPADMPNVISIAATGPVGWAVNPGSDLDVPASYTNSGQSRIDFAAPGGNDVFLNKYPTVACQVFGLVIPCGGLDFVFSTVAGGWQWVEGTSAAAPHASGIAALIVGKYGHLKPSVLEQKLREAAVDMGEPGKDAYFGQGFLDAGRAVQ